MTPLWSSFDAALCDARRTPPAPRAPFRREAWAWFALAFAAFGVRLLYTEGLAQPDYVFFAETARHGFPLSPYVLGFYPAGYFALLGALFKVVPNEMLAGQLLSLVAACACVALATTLAHGLFGNRRLAQLLGLFLLLHPSMRYWAIAPGTDLPWMALFLAALLPLLLGAPRSLALLASGALAGLSYDIRYTSIVLPPLAALLILSHFHARRGAAWLALAAWSFAFVATASPQLRIAHETLGAPFANWQGMNVYFYTHFFSEAHANTAWARHWNDTPVGLSMGGAFRLAPLETFHHWLANLMLFAVRCWVLPFPLWLLAVAGAVQLHRGSRGALLRLLAVSGIYLAGVALVLAASRFVLPLVLLLAMPAVAPFARWPRLGPAALVAMMAALLVCWSPDVSPWQRQRMAAMPAVSQVLAEHATHAAEALTSDPSFYLSRHGQLSMLPAMTPPPQSVPDLLSQMDRAHAGLVVYDSEVGGNVARGLRPLLSEDVLPGLTRIEKRESADYTVTIWKRAAKRT